MCPISHLSELASKELKSLYCPFSDIILSPARLRMTTYKIVMIRHGESEWNKENKFCGWFDAGLSEKGKQEAVAGGRALEQAGFQFDVAHTSLLTRAQVRQYRISV